MALRRCCASRNQTKTLLGIETSGGSDWASKYASRNQTKTLLGIETIADEAHYAQNFAAIKLKPY